MSLVDQIANIRALQRQGKSVIEIAAAVGVEIGDVQSILASASMPGSELPRGAVEAVTYSYYPEPHEIVLNDALPEVHIDVPPGFVSIGAIADIALPVGSRVGDAWPVVAIQVNLATPGFTALNTGSVFEASPGDPSLQGPTWTDDGAYLTGWTQVGGGLFAPVPARITATAGSDDGSTAVFIPGAHLRDLRIVVWRIAD